MKEILKYMYEQMSEKIKISESRFTILITLATALTVFSATYLNNFSPLITALSAISIIFSLVSVVYSFLAILVKRNKTKDYKKKMDRIDIFSIKDISKINEMNYLEYIKKNYPSYREYKLDNFDKDLAHEIVVTAKNVYQKNIYSNFSVAFLLISLITESVAIFLLGLGLNI